MNHINHLKKTEKEEQLLDIPLKIEQMYFDTNSPNGSNKGSIVAKNNPSNFTANINSSSNINMD